MTASTIEWTDFTWNPVRGCTRVSPGCGGSNHEGGCYAEKIAARFSGPGQPFHGFAERTKYGGRWTGKLALAPEMLTLPLRWKKPRRVFVNSMSDLFHDALPDAVIDQVFAVMALCPQHTFQVLTKRPERMRGYMTKLLTGPWAGHAHRIRGDKVEPSTDCEWRVQSIMTEMLKDCPPDALNRATLWREQNGYGGGGFMCDWPLPNVWLGTSVEDQLRAVERIPHLLATPAAVRFLSCEPLLGPLDIPYACKPHWAKGEPALLHLVIVGGESGPRARPCWTPDVRSVVRQCQRAGVSVFVKQLGANVRDRNDAGFDGCEEDSWPDMDDADIEHDLDGTLDGYQGAPVRVHLKDRKGGTMDEWPEDLRVREMP